MPFVFRRLQVVGQHDLNPKPESLNPKGGISGRTLLEFGELAVSGQ